MNQQTTSPKNSDRQFDYQFYFMFRTYRPKEGEYIEEPEKFSAIEELSDSPNPQQVIGYKIDEDDKRLFRFHLAQQPALTESEFKQHLADYWDRVRHQYDNCQVRNNVTGQVSTRNASEELLQGVAVLIIGDQLTEPDQTITIPLRDDQGEAKGHQLFTSANHTTLFSLQDTAQQMTEDMRFFEFARKYDQRFPERRKVLHWQLQLGPDFGLKPIQPEEHDNHPFLVVYGLERGKNPPEVLREQANNFLLFGKGDNGYTALLELLPKLLMCHWQFNHIDAAASQFQQQLDARNALYRSYLNERLDCATTPQLQQELQEMKTQGAEGKYTLGRLQGAMKTLQINAEDLTGRLELIQDLARERGWQIEFDSALETYFDYSLGVLQNHLSYLNSALTHLEGSSSRWQAMLEERRLELTENIGTLAHLIVFLVALVEMGKLAHENPATFAWLQWLDKTWPIEILTKFLVSPTTYVVLIIWFLRKDVWKWMTRMCRCGKLCQ